ncbi:hypothetical protein ABZ464_20820 [Streptomyces sp. NPDC005820]|uniref:hypothetical protein n=1 Tax=Streptomyces sp. NPDC005820 TaxID=3157069 RepID=UPI0033DC0E36
MEATRAEAGTGTPRGCAAVGASLADRARGTSLRPEPGGRRTADGGRRTADGGRRAADG